MATLTVIGRAWTANRYFRPPKFLAVLFNSLHYALFLPVVWALYWWGFGANRKAQNLLLLAASYYFYGCWDPRFLLLLLFSTGLDYYTGLKIEDAQGKVRKQFWLWLSIGVNLGFLGLFKYYNFFIDSFADLLGAFGMQAHLPTLKVILPVGISFYTFHGLSYVIDIYHGRIKGERSFVDYAVFVSFFALLVAGPIERATHLLPQIKQARVFHMPHAVDGLRQMLWGLFKKIVIADSCAPHVNAIFDNYESLPASSLVLGAVLFSFQIYGDFSGYSDIALGTARLFGMRLLRNFAYPYFSRDIAEFWRRWHISLSSWFRDYLYIPLGGSRGNSFERIRNVFIIFLVSGFWHGANWTFIVWGALHALFILPSIFLRTNRNNLAIVAQNSVLPTAREALAMLVTFVLATFAWIFFRAASVGQAFGYLERIFSGPVAGEAVGIGWSLAVLLLLFILMEWNGRRWEHALEHFGVKWSRAARWSFYNVVILCIYLFGGEEQQFIYFQF